MMIIVMYKIHLFSYNKIIIKNKLMIVLKMNKKQMINNFKILKEKLLKVKIHKKIL